MVYAAQHPELMDSIISIVIGASGWGGIKFILFIIMLLVAVLLWRFVNR
jgi:hypothetical protein